MTNFEIDPELGVKIHEIVERFQENFWHIDPTEILPIRTSDNKTLRAWAEVRKLPAYIRPAVVPYKVAMLVHEELYYDEANEYVQNLIVIHELTHIEPHDNIPGEYVLREHDVQEFAEMTHLLGQNWTRTIGQDIDVFASGTSDWREAIAILTGQAVEAPDYTARARPIKSEESPTSIRKGKGR